MVIDTNAPFGGRVAQRLQSEQVGWIVTVNADGTPEPSPVWFYWDGRELLVRSQPTAKLRNIRRNPRVAFHFNSDAEGDDVVVLLGTARIAERSRAPLDEAYLEKYADAIKGLGSDPERFAASYSEEVLITPTKVRGH